MLSLITYASGFAFGAVIGDSWFQGHFPPCDSKHISVKELLPIVLTVGRWGPVSINQRVLLFSDKTAVGAVTNKQHASDPHLMCLVTKSWLHVFLITYVSPPSTSMENSLLLRILSHGCRSNAYASFSPACNSYYVATLARNALSTMEISRALSSDRRYEANCNRVAAFLPTLDRKRQNLPGSPNAIIIVVQHLKEKGKAPSTIWTYLSIIAERQNACIYPKPTVDYVF